MKMKKLERERRCPWHLPMDPQLCNAKVCPPPRCCALFIRFRVRFQCERAFAVYSVVRLPAPHGDCEYADNLPVIRRGNFSLTYAANTCKRNCSARLMIQRCSCVDPITAQGLFTENDTDCHSAFLLLAPSTAGTSTAPSAVPRGTQI